MKSAIADAQPRARLTGWGPFDFSMSRFQVIEAIKPNAYLFNGPNIGYDTEIEGTAYHAVVEFTKDQSAITKIRLERGTIADTFASGPHRFDITKEVCLQRVTLFEPKLTAKYGKPDETRDSVEVYPAIRFDVRRVTYAFSDGARIVVRASYRPPGAGDKKNEHFCNVLVEYVPLRATPKSTF